jgi:ATP-dependent DNA ligase
MEQFLQDIIDEGGEGIILRDPLAPNQSGRSPGFLKHKVSFSF